MRDGMNIVHVMSLIVKVVIKCGYHVLYYPNDGIHMTPVIYDLLTEQKQQLVQEFFLFI